MARMSAAKAMAMVVVTARRLSNAHVIMKAMPHEHSQALVNLRQRQHDEAVQQYIDPFKRGKS